MADDELDLVKAFRARLQSAGVREALELVNSRARFRFTTLYQLEPGALRSVATIDRENPSLDMSGEVTPIERTYCALVVREQSPVVISNAPRDRRLADHPQREIVQSYAAVPIRTIQGTICGTLCHYDHRPRLLPPGELQLLESVAPLLADFFRTRHGDVH